MELWFTEKHAHTVHFRIKVKEQLYSAKSPFQRIDIFDTEEFGIMFTLDGLIMLTEKDEFIYHDMIAHVPMAVNPRMRNMLVGGGCDGGTVRELTRYATLQRIDMVEIDEMVVKAARTYLPFTASSLSDPRVTLYFKDGIEYVKKAQIKYDLIIVDSTDPIGPGEGLFTTEFYENCFGILTDDGILINQHESPFYEADALEMQRTHKKIVARFPVSRVYQVHIPTYPSGHWLFGFASKTLDPVNDARFDRWLQFGLKTKYYNTEIHTGCYALPTYVKEMLYVVEKK